MEDKLEYKDILSLDGEHNVVNLDVPPEVTHNATQVVINHLKETAERLKIAKALSSIGKVQLDLRIHKQKKK